VKKNLVAAGIVFIFSSAHAQSTVSLTGLLNAGIAYVSDAGNNVGHKSAFQAKSGDLNVSRWALSGREQITDDLSAEFMLMNGFSVTSGTGSQQGRLFGFQAYIGLGSRQAGTVTIGRQFDSVVQFVQPLSLGGTSYGGVAFAHPYDNDNLDNYTRTNNSIKYTSPDFSGLKFGYMYGFSNQAGQFDNSRGYSAGASYSFGSFNAGVGYLQFDNESNLSSANTEGAEPAGAPFNAGRQRTFAIGGSYQYRELIAGAVVSETRLDDATSINNVADTAISLPHDDVRFDNFEINVRYLVSRQWRLSAAYTYTAGRFATPTGTCFPKWHQVGVLSSYYLSPSTDVYAEAIYQRAVGLTGTGIQGAQISNFVRASGDNQFIAGIGIRHKF